MSEFKFSCPQCGQHIVCDVLFTNEVLAICPIHNHVIRCNGMVERGTAKPKP
jgi:hypothetical protein